MSFTNLMASIFCVLCYSCCEAVAIFVLVWITFFVVLWLRHFVLFVWITLLAGDVVGAGSQDRGTVLVLVRLGIGLQHILRNVARKHSGMVFFSDILKCHVKFCRRSWHLLLPTAESRHLVLCDICLTRLPNQDPAQCEDCVWQAHSGRL